MRGTDVFLAMAQIFVAFAGFAGIVAAVGRRAAGEWGLGDRLRFWQMIEVSLLGLLFSLLPFVFHYAESPQRDMWAMCSIFLAVASGMQTLRSGWQTLRAVGKDPSVSLSFSLIYVLLGVVFVLIQVDNALGFLVFKQQIAPYLAGVIWQICLASVLFWRLLKYSGLPFGGR